MNQVAHQKLPPEMRPKAVGARLKLLREAAGLKASELCAALGINRGSYSNFEAGRRAVPEHLKVRLAEYYGTSLDHLILGRIAARELEALIERLRARRGLPAVASDRPGARGPESMARPPRDSGDPDGQRG